MLLQLFVFYRVTHNVRLLAVNITCPAVLIFFTRDAGHRQKLMSGRRVQLLLLIGFVLMINLTDKSLHFFIRTKLECYQQAPKAILGSRQFNSTSEGILGNKSPHAISHCQCQLLYASEVVQYVADTFDMSSCFS